VNEPIKTVIRGVRWAVVLVLFSAAMSELAYLYSATDPAVPIQEPALLAAIQNFVFMLLYHCSPSFLFVAAGAKIAPRARLTTAILLAAVRVPLSLWSHVLFRSPNRNLLIVISDMLAQPWGINQHFALETLGAVLGVVYIFCSEKANRGAVIP
jgi:hypothetical protein